MMPPAPHAITSRDLSGPALAGATTAFLRDVLLLVRDVFPVDVLKQARAAMREYETRPAADAQPARRRVGHNRFLMSVPMHSALGDPAIFADAGLLSVLGTLLSDDLVLESYTAVYALPGADSQGIHRDHDTLFEGGVLDAMLPPFAVQVAIPLSDLDTRSGTTAVWMGSHRSPLGHERLAELRAAPDFSGATLPAPRADDCTLMDYRVIHAGTPNRSDAPRTILYLVYSRPWFRDVNNFNGHPRLIIGRPQVERLDAPARSLLRYADIRE